LTVQIQHGTDGALRVQVNSDALLVGISAPALAIGPVVAFAFALGTKQEQPPGFSGVRGNCHQPPWASGDQLIVRRLFIASPSLARQHMHDDLTTLTLRTQDDLQAIARMLAEAGRYHTALRIQGFATLIAEEAAVIGGPAVAPCDAPVKVTIAH
jgi:hypothetical protein